MTIVEIPDGDVMALLQTLAREVTAMREEMAAMRAQMRADTEPISETELRERFNCSYETLRRARVRGQLRGRQVGHERWFTPQAIAEWINAEPRVVKRARRKLKLA